MATVLDKPLKRLVSVDGVDYTVVLDAEGFRLTAKGKRKPQVELSWRDLLSGEAALDVALNASLTARRAPAEGQGAKASTSPGGATSPRGQQEKS